MRNISEIYAVARFYSQRTFLGLLFLVPMSCAHRTLYGPYGNYGGYSDAQLEDGSYLASFSGNGFTNAEDARGYAIFRAIEVCKGKGFQLARIGDIENNSSSKTITNTSANTYYSPYSRTAYGTATSWDETYTLPTYDASYVCTHSARVMGFKMRQLSRIDVRGTVPDLLEAVQVEDIVPGAPTEGKLEVGDIILKVNSKRIRTKLQLISAIDAAVNPEEILVELIRSQKNITVKVPTKDETFRYLEDQSKLLNSACRVREIKTRDICVQRK